ncbi:HET-domain-containing protein [Corynespora cassiicola Philippines]|uniref:HET-domain-containing protein n=1 Tax=Corynespora cassiicola Philippines TaxID=1448308 RepID=A0A2T2P354_CORCC|nr:HET-domain-containing protein [Corynespora cassiicola Philippines]
MLQYKGTRQPPRKYLLPADVDRRLNVGGCLVCAARFWTADLLSKLKRTPADKTSLKASYGFNTEELRKSVLKGCPWCRTIADGVHGRIFLDELYAEWNQESDDDEDRGSALFESDEDSDVGGKEKNAFGFNEGELSDDSTGGWRSWQDRETLASSCDFNITASFERDEGGFFAILDVHIEATTVEDDGNALSKLRGEKSVDLRYHISTKGNTPLHEVNPLFQPVHVGNQLGSAANIKYLQDWMAKNLPDTSSTRSDYEPSRLIDLGSTDSLRVVETSAIPTADMKFAALSYVWGLNQTFTLLKTTRTELMASFGLHQLPKTIQDAIIVTRCIGLRYIWVDAICIFQDSPADKTIELPKMRHIYKNAAVSIIAAISSTATEGFLHHITSDSYLIEPVEATILEDQSLGSELTLVVSYPSYYQRWRDPIHTRAWTFQELLLSDRAIVFSYRGVDVLNRNSNPEPSSIEAGREAQLPSLPFSGRFFSLKQSPENIRKAWLTARGEYTRRNLTYAGDKLVAIAAVAEEIGKSYGGRYLAGMWEKDLVTDLQWRRGDGGYTGTDTDKFLSANQYKCVERPTRYVAPSWSWASAVGEVQDFAWEDEDETYKGEMGFQILSCTVEPVVPGFEYGAVKSGILNAKGRVRSFFWRPHGDLQTQEPMESDGYLAVKLEGSDNEMPVGAALIDALEPDLEDGSVVDCVAMKAVEDEVGNDCIEGLVLLPVGETQYRRIGFFFKLITPALFEDLDPMDLEII